ncbi:MAG: NAD(P)-dependent oxidoreductase [Alphaproteobacteria bacterium]|nr:NAD(P)-dependent oxidoreductase [Alphaproteobacteria bacterium]
MSSDRIGFIGLGNMGRPMATSLVTKGFAVTAYDIVQTSAQILAQRGAKAAASVSEVVAQSDVVVTMLPNTPDVDGIVAEVLRSGRKGQMHMDMSTIDPMASKRFAAALAAKGIGWVDAGVGRSPAHAERGESLFMVGGTDADLARAMPLLEAMGNKVIRCGGPGAGITMKIVLNFLAMSTCQLTAEALTLGTKLGLTARTMYDVITNSMGNNDHLKVYWPTKVLAGDIDPGFAIDLAYKDLSIGVTTANAAGVPVFTGAAARECLGQARTAQGLGGKDITAVLVAAANNAGVKPPKL